ncbi:MAG: hypothetical protein L0Y44_05545, partial [Phycisphaerales bacterium]|nr:hypothetical protein [Phycisphaerales bacterium]MCI0677228.1 hypothetical protein [Phycisphaerales bacterium]
RCCSLYRGKTLLGILCAPQFQRYPNAMFLRHFDNAANRSWNLLETKLIGESNAIRTAKPQPRTAPCSCT